MSSHQAAVELLKRSAFVGALAWFVLLVGDVHAAQRSIPPFDLGYDPMVQIHGAIIKVERGKRVNKRRKWPSRKQVAEYSYIATDYAEDNNIDPSILMGLLWTESAFRPWAIHKDDGGSNSYGIGQMKLNTARDTWPECSHLIGPGPVRLRSKYLLDVEVNICLVTRKLAKYKKKYGRKALTVYNCGPWRCRKMRGEPKAVKAYWRNRKMLTKVGKTHLSTLPPLIADTDLFTAPAGEKGLHLDTESGCGEERLMRPHIPGRRLLDK